ncbi:MAG: hypothetical protein NVS3B5_13020 [Sphingomicrobium sp.]
MLRLYLTPFDAPQASIHEIDQTVAAAVARMDHEASAAGHGTFLSLIVLLSTIPGISTLSAVTIIAEIGTHLRRFPTPRHFLVWSGQCPDQNESAGKKKS